jgi:hypothetical protein
MWLKSTDCQWIALTETAETHPALRAPLRWRGLPLDRKLKWSSDEAFILKARSNSPPPEAPVYTQVRETENRLAAWVADPPRPCGPPLHRRGFTSGKEDKKGRQKLLNYLKGHSRDKSPLGRSARRARWVSNLAHSANASTYVHTVATRGAGGGSPAEDRLGICRGLILFYPVRNG